MIRIATVEDCAEMVRMGCAFVKASGLPLPFDPAWAESSAKANIEAEDRLALVLDCGGVHGMLCAGFGPSPLSPVRVAAELVFWIDPEYRGPWARPMIAKYEQWARDNRCRLAGLAGLQGSGVEVLYRRCGFEPAERHFMKVL